MGSNNIKSFYPGQKVTYVPKDEPGIVKSISDDKHVFVVYHCNHEWDKYEDYTAARTNIDDLILGWSYRHEKHEKTQMDMQEIYRQAKHQQHQEGV